MDPKPTEPPVESDTLETTEVVSKVVTNAPPSLVVPSTPITHPLSSLARSRKVQRTHPIMSFPRRGVWRVQFLETGRSLELFLREPCSRES